MCVRVEAKCFVGWLVTSSAFVSGKRKAFGHFASTQQLIWPGLLFFKVSCSSELPVYVVGCRVGCGQSQGALITWPFGLAALLRSCGSESLTEKTNSLALLSVAQHW